MSDSPRRGSTRTRRKPRRRPKTVIFDFDGTITRFDSSTHAVVQMILEHPLRTLAALYALPLGLPMFFSKRTEVLAGSMFVWIASTGTTRNEWLASLRRISERNAAAHRINGGIVERLREHLAAGDDVYVVTGSAATVVRSICDVLEVDVPIVGSKLKPFLGGYVSHFHCIGRRKVERMRQLHGLEQFDIVYTDSHRDIPLMLQAQSVVLVNPSRTTLSRVRAVLPPSVPLEILRQ